QHIIVLRGEGQEPGLAMRSVGGGGHGRVSMASGGAGIDACAAVCSKPASAARMARCQAGMCDSCVPWCRQRVRAVRAICAKSPYALARRNIISDALTSMYG